MAGRVGLVPATAFAANPAGTGRPSRSSRDIEAGGGTIPGHGRSSAGGQHYGETPEYDVACFPVSEHH